MDTQPLPLTASETMGEPLRFSFVDRPGLLKLTLVNLLLGLVTLGFHRFWAKTNLRRYIWACVHINDEPLEYTGTGMELFKGFLVVFAVFLLPYAILQIVFTFMLPPGSLWPIGIQYLFIALISVFWGYGFYTARRYRLSRTTWRGIRGGLAGSPMSYTWTSFGAIIAQALSLGWSRPAMNTLLQEHIISDMRFGDAAFKFRGRSGPLYGTFALCWFGSLALLAASGGLGAWLLYHYGVFDMFTSMAGTADPTDEKQMQKLGLLVLAMVVPMMLAYFVLRPVIWSFYTVRELRLFTAYTRLDGAQLNLAVTAWQMVKLTIGNLLIAVFTLSIGAPFIYRRTARFFINRLSQLGTVDLDRIRQSTARLDTRGEGLFDALDIGGLW